MDIESFVKLRIEIEELILETQKLVKQKTINESSIGIDKLRRLLSHLNSLISNKIQKKAVLRLRQDIVFRIVL